MPNPILKDVPVVSASEVAAGDFWILLVDRDEGTTGSFKRIRFRELTKALSYATLTDLTTGTVDDKVVAPDVANDYVAQEVLKHLVGAPHTP